VHNRKGPKQKAPEGCLWIEDAAPRIGVTLATLRKWRVHGKGPQGFPIGRYVAYRIADLDAFLEGQYRAATESDPVREHDSRPPEARLAPHSRRTRAAA
jgi:hypothetical protein